ncbi:serine/threonine-protein kinase [Streptomyces sp. NBC_00878]|uniref:serine/threonine-protein kinase n=1 Tax=Streptomyces sp. NBC_00878 TaxID=2975854 RepID=UPI00225212E7|nr:serine/threonine-protein kinase [Streptomyces sp. NBC_00878]MCX4907586.1 serine/threonine protein kinase [Streptomyces sp. NBC_00878]
MQPLAHDDPSRIGPYRLLGRLGAGGMGRVYLARAAGTGSGPDSGTDTVAVKLVRAEIAEQDEFRRRFAREVRAARRVGGKWTARVLDADTDADIPWVATAYVPGPTLQAVVRGDFGPLPSASAHVLANRMGLALRAIHAAGLVHRDLKPSNVLLTVDGPRVIDFGIAHVLDAPADSTITPAGNLVGSPEFMSPEQVRGDRITPAGDVFSLGCVLAYAATGCSPFAKDGTAVGVHALLFRIAYEEPDLTALPEALIDLVRECLAKDPAERPSVDEVVEHTRRAPAGAWLPAPLLARLDRAATQPVPTSPQRMEREAPQLTELPDFPDPSGNRDPLDVPEAGIAPPRIRTAPLSKRALMKRRAVGLLVSLAAAMSVYVATHLVLLVKETVAERSSTSDRVADEAREAKEGDEAKEYPQITGPWVATVPPETGSPFSMIRLDLVEAEEPGDWGAHFIVATHDAVCTGRSRAIEMDEYTLVLGNHTVSSITPPGASTRQCTLPGSVYLDSEPGKILFQVGKTPNVRMTPTEERGAHLLKEFQGAWSADRLSLTIGSGTPGTATVTGVDTNRNRHCEWSAIIMSAGDELITAPAHLDRKASDAKCKAPSLAYSYRFGGFDGASIPSTLTRTPLPEGSATEFRRLK